MNSFYRPTTTDMRSLDADDVAGLCEIYPPGRDVPACDASEAEPFGGFDPRCDQPATSTTSPLSFDNPDPEKRGASCQCDVARTSAGHEPFGAALALAGLVAVGTRRRSRR
jgi:MYXO-CTERM domain-containing protein